MTEDAKPKRRGRPRTSEVPRIDVVVTKETADRFDNLMDSVRAVGHARTSPRTLLSALIWNEKRRGKALESGLLMPYRNAHPDAD